MSSLFEDAVDVPLWLEADRDTSYATRIERDRNIARETKSRDPVARVRNWWRELASREASTEEPRSGRRLARARTAIGVALLIVGAAFGAAVAGAVFRYDGSEPVNVVRVLGILVLPQILLVLLSLLVAAGRVPGLGGLQALLAALNPGAIAAGVYRRLAGNREPSTPQLVSDLFAWHSQRTASGRFARWQMLTWSQASAVAFNLAALGTAFALIAFSDLAFGWSTTLELDARAAHAIVTSLAAPWRDWWPMAVPDLALIEQSRYYRLDRAPLTEAPGALGGWWPFLVAALVTYGLLPRVLLLLVSVARLRAATRRLLLDDPRVTALLDRMTAPAVRLEAPEPEKLAPSGGLAPSSAWHGTPGAAHVIVWAGSLDARAVPAFVQSRLGVPVERIAEAGGGRSLEEDRASIRELESAGAPAVMVLVRAWEPPLLDLLDFLETLRGAVGRDVSIVILPVPAEGGGVDDTQQATWKQTIARLRDPATYVEVGVTPAEGRAG